MIKRKKEVLHIIYTLKIKKEEENLITQDIQDFILEKISFTLSQDIIILIKNSRFEEENPDIPDKIKQFIIKNINKCQKYNDIKIYNGNKYFFSYNRIL